MTQDKAQPTPPAVPSDELLPCPFCGSPSHWDCTSDDSLWWSGCRNCDIETAPYSTRSEAIDAWNTRAAPVASNTTAEPAPIQPAGVEASQLKTGWPPSELMQDDHGGLSKALSNTPHARLNAREAAQAIRAAASQGDRGKT